MSTSQLAPGSYSISLAVSLSLMLILYFLNWSEKSAYGTGNFDRILSPESCLNKLEIASVPYVRMPQELYMMTYVAWICGGRRLEFEKRAILTSCRTRLDMDWQNCSTM